MSDAVSPRTERFELIDALRGFALAGVLLVNLHTFSLYDYLPAAAREALPSAGFDAVARAMVDVFVESKAITLFSLLFGLGFAMQMERENQLARFVRRLIVLAVIGLAHTYLLWWGDILFIYGMLAFLLIPFRGKSDRVLLASGLTIALVAQPLLAPLMQTVLANIPSMEDMFAANLDAFRSPSYAIAIRQNAEYSNWTYAGFWNLYLFIIGRFLLGYWAGRRRLLQQPEEHRRLLLALCLVGFGVGTAITVTTHLTPALAAIVFDRGLAMSPLHSLIRAIEQVGPLAMGAGYAAGFALLFMVPRLRSALRLLAPVGRMALTNYLTHTLVCVPIFYGWGLGVGPGYGMPAILVGAALLFTLQIAWSHWWFARFHIGPAEWVWRSLTYGAPQPFLRSGTGLSASRVQIDDQAHR